jgi:hypothetical protein
MAGSLSGIPLSQQFDSNGNLLKGAVLYIFNANTTTPQLMYQDVALTVPHVYPLPVDSNGRIPMFYLADGSVHARFQDKDGNILFDIQSILVIGPSAGAAPSGGVDANAILSTGDMKFRPTSEILAGWVRANGRTIGSAISGAAERANADVAALFSYLWNNFPDTIATVSGGRGANGPADFAANKTITVPDFRARSAIGLADMGNADSGRLANVTFSIGGALVAASSGGLGTFALAQAQLPAVNFTHSGTTLSAETPHRHFGYSTDSGINITLTNSNRPQFAGFFGGDGATNIGAGNADCTIGLSSAQTVGLTIAAQGVAASGGSGTVLQNMPPFITGTWYMRL